MFGTCGRATPADINWRIRSACAKASGVLIKVSAIAPAAWQCLPRSGALFEVPRAMPTIGLPLRLRLGVPHDEIDRGQDGAGERQKRGDKDHGFGHATTLITASASAQTPIHSANTAIVPKATRPMPVIASLIGASLDLVPLSGMPSQCSTRDDPQYLTGRIKSG